MRFTIFGLLVVVASLLDLGACNKGGSQGGCITTPTGPTCVNGKEDDSAGPAPGQGGAKVTYAIFEDDCRNPDDSQDFSRCTVEVSSESGPALEDGSEAIYLVKSRKQVYTIVISVQHLQIPGWTVNAKSLIHVSSSEIQFDEGDPAFKSPARFAMSFSLTTPDGVHSQKELGGTILLIERRRVSIQTHWRVKLFFSAPA